MKILGTILTLSAVAHGHYNFPSMIYKGATTVAWAYVRQWTGYYTYDPVVDVTSIDIRCNVDGSTAGAGVSTLSIAAGSTLGFTANPDIYHPGPLLVYMAKVPAGSTASSWDGSGDVWFKIYDEGPIFGSALTWPTDSAVTVSFPIPATLPNGDYLIRVEHIGLHVASSVGAAQFYISCGQVTVTGGGSGTPSPLVAFPGAYSATDPGILIDIYYPVPTAYTMPGPPIWTGGGAVASSTHGTSTSTTKSTSTSTLLTTTKATTLSTTSKSTTVSTTPKVATSTSSSKVATTTASTGGGTVPLYGQCGGTGWTGGTVCASGTCTFGNTFYSQCLA